CQLFDRIAAVQEDALVTVDVGDFRFAGGGRHEARIKGEATRGGEAPYVNNIGTNSAGQYGQLDGGCALDDQLRFFVSHVRPPINARAWKSSDVPVQGPQHYREINSKVNLRQAMR